MSQSSPPPARPRFSSVTPGQVPRQRRFALPRAPLSVPAGFSAFRLLPGQDQPLSLPAHLKSNWKTPGREPTCRLLPQTSRVRRPSCHDSVASPRKPTSPLQPNPPKPPGKRRIFRGEGHPRSPIPHPSALTCARRAGASGCRHHVRRLRVSPRPRRCPFPASPFQFGCDGDKKPSNASAVNPSLAGDQPIAGHRGGDAGSCAGAAMAGGVLL